MKVDEISYELLLEYLPATRIEVQQMFGHQCVYFDGLMVMFLINKTGNPDNGICLATSKEHISSLAIDIQSLRHLHAYGPESTDWRLIPADSEYFEADTETACNLILKRDFRIGRTPKKKPSEVPTAKKRPVRKR